MPKSAGKRDARIMNEWLFRCECLTLHSSVCFIQATEMGGLTNTVLLPSSVQKIYLISGNIMTNCQAIQAIQLPSAITVGCATSRAYFWVCPIMITIGSFRVPSACYSAVKSPGRCHAGSWWYQQCCRFEFEQKSTMVVLWDPGSFP